MNLFKNLKHQQKPDIMSKIHQDELNGKMNRNTWKNWDTIYDLDNWKCCIINIICVYVVALEPRQNDGSNLVTETSIPPTNYHIVDRQVDEQIILAAASQTVDGHPNSRESSNNSSQEPQRGMDEIINDPLNSPAIQYNDRDTGFTDVHLTKGRITEEDSVPTHPSAPVPESDFNLSMEPLRVSDVSGTTPLPQARSQHSGDNSCRDEEDDIGFQTDAGRHAGDLSQLSVSEQAADGNPFHRAAARSTQNDQPSDVNRINNTSTSLVNFHGESGDPGGMKLHTDRSTDPGNGSTTEPTYRVHVPARAFYDVEMASINLASARIRNTKEEASGRGQNENRGDATSIQETDSAQPKHPQYASKVQRINSFQGWPALRQIPEEMAECGFYYEGFKDCVHCFHCGVQLQRWLHEDEPWFEHARWSPSCLYVHKNKGKDFVQLAVKTAEMEAAKKNATEKDLSTNGQESADSENKDMNEAAVEHEPDMNPDTFEEVTRQHQELYDRTICRICLVRKRCVIFLHCGHFGTCVWCSNLQPICPFCRSVIVKRIKTNCFENE
ncbi:hypothetical protein ACJMK2_029193 [Sinanodonta woodiana]|uniref:RING-type domain-containing protein n=1 Tax=Sinanodonta woodiana TaxID=1069815 RepID=A0ABD3X9F6_SINWO